MNFALHSTNTGSAELDEHIGHVRSVDWASTGLGPLESWPQDLLQLAHIMMFDPEPKLLLLGPSNHMLYNVAYAKAVAGDKHPEALGMTQMSAWAAEVDADVIDTPNTLRDAGLVSKTISNYHVPLKRNGYWEERVLSWTLIPLAGHLTGVFVSLTDVTDAYVRQRRQTARTNFEKACNAARDTEALWEIVPRSLASANPHDLSFALLLSVCKKSGRRVSDQLLNSNCEISFELSSFSESLRANASTLESFQSSPFLKRAVETRERVYLRSTDKDFAKPWSRAFAKSDSRNGIVVCPLSSDKSEDISKVLVIGLTPHPSYDEAYQNWISQVVQVAVDRNVSLRIVEEEHLQAQAEALERAQQIEHEARSVSRRLLKMQHIVDQANLGIFELLPSGVLSQSNEAYHTLSGIPKAYKGVEEMSFVNHVYPEDYDHVMSQWASMTRGTATSFEMRYKAPLNEYGEDFQWILAVCIPLMDANGIVTSIYGFISDIGAQKRAERQTRARTEALEQLAVSEERFHRFMEHVPIAVFVTNEKLESTYVNSHWFDLMGHQRTADFKSIDWQAIVHEDDLVRVQNIWGQIVSGLPTNIEFRLKQRHDSNGPSSITWIMATALPEMDGEGGALKQVIGTLTDISHFKFAEDAQQLRMDQAIEAKRQQENFIDMTSHEIRNPLSAVMHCIDSIGDSLIEMDNLAISLMLSPGAETAKQLREYIEGSIDSANTIKSCTDHQRRIVDDILILSKMDSNLLQISPVAMQARHMLEVIDKMFEAEAARECVNLNTEADASLDRMKIDWLLLDHGRINQVLINLITNAIKFTKGRETRNVTIRMGASEVRPCEADLGINFDMDFSLGQSARDVIYDGPEFAENEIFLWFAVQDTGRGMTKEEKGRIFSRFAQASPRTYSEYGGSGLGLYISHSLVGLQGGEIGVATKPGVGSTFSFFVKTCRAPEMTLAKLDSHHQLQDVVAAKHLNGTNGSKSSRGCVLIVEDNLLNQRVLKKQLSKVYDVYTADNGQEALDFLRMTQNWRTQTSSDLLVDVILMDWEMPILNGLDCAKTIRKLQKTGDIRNHIPIIAVSANARPEQMEQALEAMDDAISKPFRIPDLTPKIDRMVSWARASQ